MTENGRHRDADERAADLLRAAPGLARIAGTAWVRTAQWTVGASLRTWSRVARAAVSGESPAELFAAEGAELRDQVRRVLGLEEPATDDEAGADAETQAEGKSPRALRARGEELLRRSADVSFVEDTHPAYARILDELSPDEARILRFLATDGAQPSVDVRTGRPLNVGSQMVAPGLNMIGAQAGCRNLERVPAYLNNLYRLGLIWFSREPLEDPMQYQVLEAQPDVLAAMREAGRGKTVRRSIALTPFGEDFCLVCLPVATAEMEALVDPLPPPGLDTEDLAAPARPPRGPSARPGGR